LFQTICIFHRTNLQKGVKEPDDCYRNQRAFYQSLLSSGKNLWRIEFRKCIGIIDRSTNEEDEPTRQAVTKCWANARQTLTQAIEHVASTMGKRAVPLIPGGRWPLVVSSSVDIAQQVTQTVPVTRYVTEYKTEYRTQTVPVARMVTERVPVTTMQTQRRTRTLPDGRSVAEVVQVPVTTYVTQQKQVTENVTQQYAVKVPVQMPVMENTVQTRVVQRRVREYLEPMRVALDIDPTPAYVFYLPKPRLEFLEHRKATAMTDDFASWRANWIAVDTQPPVAKVCSGVEYVFRAYWNQGQTFKRDRVKRDTHEPIVITPDPQ
jgi:hypothetical protein